MVNMVNGYIMPTTHHTYYIHPPIYTIYILYRQYIHNNNIYIVHTYIYRPFKCSTYISNIIIIIRLTPQLPVVIEPTHIYIYIYIYTYDLPIPTHYSTTVVVTLLLNVIYLQYRYNAIQGGWCACVCTYCYGQNGWQHRDVLLYKSRLSSANVHYTQYTYVGIIHIGTRRIAPARAEGNAFACVNYQIKRTYVTSYRKRPPPPPPFRVVLGFLLSAREIYDHPAGRGEKNEKSSFEGPPPRSKYNIIEFCFSAAIS